MDLEHLRDPRSSWHGGTPVPPGKLGPPNRALHRRWVARLRRYLNQAWQVQLEAFAAQVESREIATWAVFVDSLYR